MELIKKRVRISTRFFIMFLYIMYKTHKMFHAMFHARIVPKYHPHVTRTGVRSARSGVGSLTHVAIFD